MIEVDNPFGHILYEIEMYLYTYKLISDNQIGINLIIEARAIHLRNLAVFFYKEKTKRYWHVGDFIDDIGSVKLLTDETLFKDIKNYTSRATAHLSDDRLKETHKRETMECYEKAHPIIIDAITSMFTSLDNHVKPKYNSNWLDPNVQNLESHIKEYLLSSNITADINATQRSNYGQECHQKIRCVGTTGAD